MKKDIRYPFLGIVTAEMIIFFGQTTIGLGLHVINFIAIILLTIFGKLDIKEKNILQSMTLLIILRMINMSTPQFFTTTLIQYSVIYGIMFLPIYNLINNQRITTKELGINLRNIYLYIPLGAGIGFIAAIFENYIVNPSPMVDIRFYNIILISIIMFAFVGTVEELIFRGILQTRLSKVFGNKASILLSGGSFGIMHSSYSLMSEILFVTIFGIALGYLFYKTHNVIFTTIIHGTTNVILFSGLLRLIMR